MTYNSVHRFTDIKDARKFVETLRDVGFKDEGLDKKGGVIYSNGTHRLMIFVQN